MVNCWLCWRAVTRLAGANAPACFLLKLKLGQDDWTSQHRRSVPENHEDLVERVGAAASRFQTKMLLAQTFTKVLTSLLSLVTDSFCCGMFALFKTESASNTVNPLRAPHPAPPNCYILAQVAFWEWVCFRRDDFTGFESRSSRLTRVCFPDSEQDQSDCSGVHGGPARGDDWLGLQGEIQQKKCFRGSLMSKTFVSYCSQHFCFSSELLFFSSPVEKQERCGVSDPVRHREHHQRLAQSPDRHHSTAGESPVGDTVCLEASRACGSDSRTV